MQKIVIAAIIITPNNMLYPSGLYIPFLKAIQYMDIMNGLSENAPIIRYDITITYPMTGDIISPTVIWIMQKVIVISRLIAIRLITRPVRLVFCIIICLSIEIAEQHTSGVGASLTPPVHIPATIITAYNIA